MRIMRALNLVYIGEKSFNPNNAYDLTKHWLKVSFGYLTAINEYKGGLNVKHQVMKTMRDLM